MLEFRADPESPYYDKEFDREKTVIVVLRLRQAIRAGRARDAAGYGLQDVRNLGGFRGWADSGGAVERSEAHERAAA